MHNKDKISVIMNLIYYYYDFEYINEFLWIYSWASLTFSTFFSSCLGRPATAPCAGEAGCSAQTDASPPFRWAAVTLGGVMAAAAEVRGMRGRTEAGESGLDCSEGCTWGAATIERGRAGEREGLPWGRRGVTAAVGRSGLLLAGGLWTVWIIKNIYIIIGFLKYYF